MNDRDQRNRTYRPFEADAWLHLDESVGAYVAKEAEMYLKLGVVFGQRLRS